MTGKTADGPLGLLGRAFGAGFPVQEETVVGWGATVSGAGGTYKGARRGITM